MRKRWVCAVEGEQAVLGIGTGRMGSGEAQLQAGMRISSSSYCQQGLHVTVPRLPATGGCELTCQAVQLRVSWTVPGCVPAHVCVLWALYQCLHRSVFPAGKADQPPSQHSIGPVSRPASQPALRTRSQQPSQARPSSPQRVHPKIWKHA